MPTIQKLASELVDEHGAKAHQKLVDLIQVAVRDGSITQKSQELRRLQMEVEVKILHIS